MPPLREKSFADEKNPFFEPVAFWFNTEEKGQHKQSNISIYNSI